MRPNLIALTLSTAATLVATRFAAADFVIYANPTSWANHAGGTPTQANLFNYLGFNFPTQVVPDTVFGDLGVTMHSSGPLVAHDPTWGGWYITPGIQGAQIEILFSTPQNAIYLNSAAMTPGDGPENVLQNQSIASFYSGSTLLGSVNVNSIGAISSVAMDRVVITVSQPSYIPAISNFYFVPGPGALGLACCAAALGGSRRRRG